MNNDGYTPIGKRIFLSGLLALAALGSGTAGGATATANLSVTAEVLSLCTITTLPVAFGAYDPTSVTANDAGTGTVILLCTLGADTTVTLGQGANAAGGSSDAVPLRQMASGANRLAYFLYQDAGRTTVWGNTAGTGVSHTGTGLLTNISVYGRIPAEQNVPFGVYTDTVVATVTF